jgi:hypothetical protein
MEPFMELSASERPRNRVSSGNSSHLVSGHVKRGGSGARRLCDPELVRSALFEDPPLPLQDPQHPQIRRIKLPPRELWVKA